jgi:hypothetical protein
VRGHLLQLCQVAAADANGVSVPIVMNGHCDATWPLQDCITNRDSRAPATEWNVSGKDEYHIRVSSTPQTGLDRDEHARIVGNPLYDLDAISCAVLSHRPLHSCSGHGVVQSDDNHSLVTRIQGDLDDSADN